jgi:hypothetical protein
MNRLARASGIAVSALTAATATILLLVPGHARLVFPSTTNGTADGVATSPALGPEGGGPRGGSSAGRQVHGLTVNGSASPSGLSGLSGTGDGPAGAGFTGGHHALSAGSLRPALPPLSLELPVVTSVPGPAGTIGDPGARCLRGYVWRQAYAGDYICVTPGARTQAVIDNAAAADRITNGGGAFGAYTCQPGYVWRQVVPADYVCVTPGTRAQAAADNAQANNRVALLTLWLSDWTSPAQPPEEKCSSGVCATTEGGSDGPNFQINGDHLNFGPVLLQIRRNDGTVLWSMTVTAASYAGFAGGALYARTPIGDCSGVPGTVKNDYVIAFDTVARHWSNAIQLDSDCGAQ